MLKLNPFYFGTSPGMKLQKVKVRVRSDVTIVIPALNPDRAKRAMEREFKQDKKYTSGELLEEIIKHAKISDMEVLKQ